jgi:hypothetical protein
MSLVKYWGLLLLLGLGFFFLHLFYSEKNFVAGISHLLLCLRVLTSCLSVSLISRSWKTLRHSFLQTLTIWVTVWNLQDRGQIQPPGPLERTGASATVSQMGAGDGGSMGTTVYCSSLPLLFMLMKSDLKFLQSQEIKCKKSHHPLLSYCREEEHSL